MTTIERRRQIRKLIRNYERDLPAALRPFVGQQVTIDSVKAMFDAANGPTQRLVNSLDWLYTVLPRVSLCRYLDDLANQIRLEVCDE